MPTKAKERLFFLSNLGKIWILKPTKKPLALAIISTLIEVGIIIFFFSRFPPKIPLFYSLPWGEKQLTGPITLFLLPGLSIGITGVNTTLATLLLEKRRFLSVCLVWVSFLFSLLALTTLIKITLLII